MLSRTKQWTGAVILCALMALTLGANHARAAMSVLDGTVSVITGPSGLDLDGKIVYAFNFDGANNAHTVAGVTFASDAAAPAGGSFVLPQNVSPWQTTPNFGAGADEVQLANIYADIHWANSGAGEQLQVNLPTLAGRNYKMQLLVYGNNNENRNWDVELNGALVVDEFSSLGGAPYANNVGVVYTNQFVADGDGLMNLRMNGNINGAAMGGDRNPIMQGISLEELPTTFPALNGATTGTFMGGDVGEGLDLDGDFVYAVNVRGPGGLTVRDATFTTDTAPGVSVDAGSEILNWINPNYGNSTNDNNLEVVMQSIRHDFLDGDQIAVDLAVEPTAVYKLQLLFGEGCCDREFDVLVEGVLVASELFPRGIQGGAAGQNNTGALLTYEFKARDSIANILLDGLTNPTFRDNNPILNGFTLELISAPIPEPATATLGLLGLAGLMLRRRRAA